MWGEQRLLWGGRRGGGPAGRGEAGLAFPPRGLMAGGGPTGRRMRLGIQLTHWTGRFEFRQGFP